MGRGSIERCDRTSRSRPATSNEDQLRTSRAILNNRFIRLRTASHRAPEFLPQLGLILSGVTYRLYNVWWDIIAFKREVELAIDEQQLMIDEQQQATDRVQLATLAAAQNIPPTVLPVSTINTAAPANDVAEPTLLPPAAAP